MFATETKRGWLGRRTKLLTKLMFESKLIWMYFQSNSIPLAPTHRGRHLEIQNKTKTEKYNDYNNKKIFCKKDITVYLDITSSAVAQPIAATMILYSPLPGLRDITRWRPSRSARSTVAFINSYNTTQTLKTLVETNTINYWKKLSNKMVEFKHSLQQSHKLLLLLPKLEKM